MVEKVAVILAAGQSTRMNTQLPKVLHEVCGRPMLEYVIDACREAGVGKILVVVGYGGQQIKQRYSEQKDLVFVEQPEQRGTGDAVICCRAELEGYKGLTLVLCGDAPLIRTATLTSLMETHRQEAAAVTLATAVMDDPAGYGRIVRDARGNIQRIVEGNDCDAKQLAIKEVNTGYFCFSNSLLLEALGRLRPDNKKNEYYLTDVLHLLIAAGHKAAAIPAVPAEEAMGVNSRYQLSVVGKIMQRRIQQNLMNAGVTIIDPPNTWIDARARIGQDTVIEPFTCIYGRAVIGANCRIGPFAYLRDGAVLGEDVHLGAFTELSDTKGRRV